MDGFSIARIRGIDIRVNWSVLVIALLITWSLAEALLPEYAEGHSAATYWVTGSFLAAAFFAGLLAHEIGHSIVALREGVEVKSITLWLFGGVASLESQPRSPGTAFRVAVAGPIVSVVLGVVGLAAALLTSGIVSAALTWFGAINLVLVAFNLLPAFPLDGGRIYQAWQWHRSGDELGATRRAADLGLKLGAVLVGLGVLEMMVWSIAGGVWMVMIGWFIREAARAEWRQASIEGPLARYRVHDVMSTEVTTARADASIADFIAGMYFGGMHAAYPVVDASGATTGLISVKDVRLMSTSERAHSTVGEATTPISGIVVTTSRAPLVDLVRAMNTIGDRRALVIDDGTLVGIVAPSDIARLISLFELSTPDEATTTVGPSSPTADHR